MPVERIIAIDFGTSTSVVRVKRYQDGQPVGDRLETKPVTFNMGSTVVPTLIQKRDTGENLYFGYEAEIPRRNTEICSNFKVDLESPDPAVQERARGLTAEFFKYLFKTYREQSLGGHLGESDDRERTVISYPVKWSEDTKAFMLETARNAGFPNVEGQDEAQAAIQAVTVQSEKHLCESGYFTFGVPVNILLIDMGAGTTDLVLCRYTPGDPSQTNILSTWPHGSGTLFGGREVDELLRGYIKSLLPADCAEKVLKKIGEDKFKAWKEHEVSPALARGDTVDYFSVLDDRLEDMEIDVDYSISRQTFEDFCQGYLRGLPELVSGCLRDAGVNGGDVDLAVLTGGHSQWYFGRDILSGTLERFEDVGLKKIQADPGRIISIALPQETVALGLAYHPLRALPPKPAPEPEPNPPRIITPMPPVLHRLVRPDRPTRPSLPGKNAGIDEIKAFYRKNQWVSTFLKHSIYLQSDGTVVAVGINKDGPYIVQNWKNWRDIVSIDSGPYYTVGLRSDGTVVVLGINKFGQCNVQNWRDIVSINCDGGYTVGLRSDGLVVAVGDNEYGQCDVQNWRDIVAINCDVFHTVGLRSDGTVVVLGIHEYGQYDVQNWRDIVSINCGGFHTVGLRSDGTVVAVGDNEYGQCDVQNWRDIVAIACGAGHTVGLRSDGTVVAVGWNEFSQCNVHSWKNVLSISAKDCRTVAILYDGSVIETDYEEKDGRYFSLPTKTLPFKLF